MLELGGETNQTGTHQHLLPACSLQHVSCWKRWKPLTRLQRRTARSHRPDRSQARQNRPGYAAALQRFILWRIIDWTSQEPKQNEQYFNSTASAGQLDRRELIWETQQTKWAIWSRVSRERLMASSQHRTIDQNGANRTRRRREVQWDVWQR